MSPGLEAPPTPPRARARIEVAGRAQGVGLRPFVARLAHSLSLAGWVRNDSAGATIEIEGDPDEVERFLVQLRAGTPASGPLRPRARPIAAQDEPEFRILASDLRGGPVGGFPADRAACAECLREMRDPADRRRRYPFINCAHCGPRASIVASLPYDRERTSMAKFPMCARCRREYESPADRRYHAEAISCAECGPRLQWVGARGEAAGSADALDRASEALRAGGVVVVKGISGFHLMADAARESAILRLREIKRRDAKPFAVMYPDLARLELDARLKDAERAALATPEAPIVLVGRRPGASIAPSVAPDNPLIGAMLAYAPLHHLLLESVGGPLVATSANFDEEPICFENEAAIKAFLPLVDGALLHDRDIVRPADDPVRRVLEAGPTPIRMGRGDAPVSIDLPAAFEAARHDAVLALGGQEKASVALAEGGAIRLSRHLGDLTTLPAREAHERAARETLALSGARPRAIACDLHPDYFTSSLARRLAEELDCELRPIQHHAAHFYSALLDAADAPEGAAGLCFDGTGLGADGSVWGAEWIVADAGAREGWRRIATMVPIALPGGEACVREPWRVAIALAHGAGLSPEGLEFFPDPGGETPAPTARRHVEGMLAKSGGGASASSLGRLFDGVASILGLRHRARFSSQAAMELEFEAMRASGRPCRFEIPVLETPSIPALDWRPTIAELISARRRGEDTGAIAAGFHLAIARACAALARRLGIQSALLTGGCFQNKLLAEGVAEELGKAGVPSRAHARIPGNDGGLAAGQALATLIEIGKR